MNIVSIIPMFCFTAAVSFLKLSFGFFKLIIKPKQAVNKTKIIEKTGRRIAEKISSISNMSAHTVNIRTGIAVIHRCRLSFALSTSHAGTGIDCKIHMLFPSSEIDGAVMSFMETINETTTAAARTLKLMFDFQHNKSSCNLLAFSFYSC